VPTPPARRPAAHEPGGCQTHSVPVLDFFRSGPVLVWSELPGVLGARDCHTGRSDLIRVTSRQNGCDLGALAGSWAGTDCRKKKDKKKAAGEFECNGSEVTESPSARGKCNSVHAQKNKNVSSGIEFFRCKSLTINER
jgi:hypothetical protein